MNNFEMNRSFHSEDSLKKEFKETFSVIRASECLKSDTLRKMQEEDQRRISPLDKTPVKKLKIWRYGIPAAAVIFCAVLSLRFLTGGSGTPYVTQMEEGAFYDSVKLEDGEIRFISNRVAISVTPNAGEIVIGEQDYETAQTGQELDAEETADSGGLLTFQRTKAVSLPFISEENWSYIGEQKIYVTVLKTDEVRYQAVFETDGAAYEVIGSNVTQKEFIDFLYQKIKSLKK